MAPIYLGSSSFAAAAVTPIRISPSDDHSPTHWYSNSVDRNREVFSKYKLQIFVSTSGRM